MLPNFQLAQGEILFFLLIAIFPLPDCQFYLDMFHALHLMDK